MRRARRGAIVVTLLALLAAIAVVNSLYAQDRGAPAAPRPGAAASEAAPTMRPGGPNAFNRLMIRPAPKVNAPPAEDGIHDPGNPGTHSLQWPAEAFQALPKSGDGNRIDWVRALNQNQIQPRVARDDPNAEPTVLELDIVREVKGSMPDVVYPHKAHTQWLDCTNCHDEIFVPEKGKNQISMAAILLGQACGVCHGKVAFPVSDCRRCHAKPKTPEQLRALANRQGGLGP